MKRFLVDDMLGKLVRWLRIAGYDTIYTKPLHLSDAEIAVLAKRSRRVLITRDRALAAVVRNSVLLKETSLRGQLKELLEEVNMKTPSLSRCPLCNGTLANAAKNRNKERIPKKVYENIEEFWKCESCGQIYWEGTHWKRIREFVTTLT